MAQKSPHAEHNRMDELFNRDLMERYYGSSCEQTRIALLGVRSADWRVISCRQKGVEPEPELIDAAAAARQQLPANDPMVASYLPYIDHAFAKGI